jgi:hypothetical protein
MHLFLDPPESLQCLDSPEGSHDLSAVFILAGPEFLINFHNIWENLRMERILSSFRSPTGLGRTRRIFLPTIKPPRREFTSGARLVAAVMESP